MRILLLILALLFAVPAAGDSLSNDLERQGINKLTPKDLNQINTFNVLDYGAVANGTTDDAAAIRLAITAACAASAPRRLYFPTGDYRVGDSTNTTFKYLLPITCGNIEILGDGPENTELLVGNAEGYYMFYSCSTVAHNLRGDCDTQITNITYRDFKITDDDPEAHGHGYYIIGSESLSGGTPAHGDTVTWTGGAGTVQDYDLGSDGYIRVFLTSGAFVAPEDVTDGVWSTTGSTLIGAPADDEGHGIGTRNVKTVTVDNVHLADLSDEGLDFTLDSLDVFVNNVRATGCSQLGAGGGCIAFQANSSGTISNSHLEGGTRSVTGTGSLIAIEHNNVGEPAVGGINITGVVMRETSAAAADKVESGLKITANSGAIDSVTLAGSVIEVDHANGDAIIVVGDNVNVTALSVSGSTIIGSSNVEPAARASLAGNTLSMDATIASAHQGWDVVSGNMLEADNADTILVLDTEGASATGNHFGLAANDCVRIANSFVSVQDNTFDTCGGGAGSGHHAVLEDNSHNESIVRNNIYYNNPSGGQFYVGTGAVGVSDDANCTNHASKGAATVCLNNITEN